MEGFYIKIDDEFLATINPELSIKLKKVPEEILKRNSKIAGYFIRICPYCNRCYQLWTGKDKMPQFCAFCGESNPYYKIDYSIRKARILYDIAEFYLSNGENEGNKEKIRVLLEQSIVVLATGIELFFKEMFVIGMDLKFVKNEQSLFSKFYKEAKNEFINIGKIIQKFSSDLKIDLNSILEEDLIRKLNILMLKRNVIVHNNGNADNIFISQSDINCKIGDPIPIENKEIMDYFLIVGTMVRNVKQEMDKLIDPELLKRIEFHFK